MTNFPIRLILDNIRSSQNVGAILRTADACGIERVYACGLTPHPNLPKDPRPAHVADANHRAIAKTALGAELTVPITYVASTADAMVRSRADGYKVIMLEQAESSLSLFEYAPDTPMALVVGNEVTGIDRELLDASDIVLELPMIGRKESLNVSVAAGIAMYHLRFGS